MKSIEPLDQEEKDLMYSLDNDEWISDFNKSVKQQYEEAARLSLAKRRETNIRIKN
jgi:hypothetical protein